MPADLAGRKGAVALPKRRAIWLFTAVIAVILPVAAMADQVPAALLPLSNSKEAIAADLARQIAMCSQRQDSRNIAFRGCVDWHSAVHGMWALVAYEKATGDHQYARLVASILNKQGVAQELEHLRQSPSFEMPYGRAWFLRLAMDHNALTGSPDLLAMGDAVSQSLRDYFRRIKIDPLSREYDSASWALINLFDYARYRGHGELQAEVEGWIAKTFVSRDQKCPSDQQSGEFMAICTNWAALVSRVMEKEAYARWLDKFIELNGLPAPVTNPMRAHHHGLNFSRAWGLWDMYAKSGRSDVLDAYVASFDRGFKPSSNWNGSYYEVGHWVAQFGMFALQPLFGAKAGR
jgi:hypothetical protein